MNLALYWAYVVELILGSLAGGAFIGLYLGFFPGWVDRDLTRNVMAFSGIVETFYVYYLYRTLSSPTNPPGASAGWTRFILFTILTAVVVWRLVMLVRVIRTSRRSRHESRS